MSSWDENPDFPKVDWQYEVANGDTTLGYQTWAQHKQEIADDEAMS